MRGRITRHLTLLAVFVPSALDAQHVNAPIEHSPYFAIGSDVLRQGYEPTPLFVSAGLERSRAGSRWSFRFGADYHRLGMRYADTRWEDFGLGVAARYGRRSGAIRPYLLGGIGIADLRVRGRWVKYEEVSGTISGPIDSAFTSTSRWNGSITPGLGTEVRLGRVQLFSEVRLNFYPARLSDARKPRQMRTTKALFIGVKL